jgi:hypothetical protein
MSTTAPTRPARRRLPRAEVFWARLASHHRPPHCGYSRWSCPRVHADVPVTISLQGSQAIALRTNDLSLLGLQVRCDLRTAACFRPDHSPGGEPVYVLEMRLGIDGADRTVMARGRLVHVTLLPDAPPEQEVAVGFKLQHFEDDGARILEHFVSHHLRPAPAP